MESFWQNTTHYAETREQLAARSGRHPSCYENRATPLCGNGSYHAKLSRFASLVDCAECLKRLGRLEFIADSGARRFISAALAQSMLDVTTRDGAEALASLRGNPYGQIKVDGGTLRCVPAKPQQHPTN